MLPACMHVLDIALDMHACKHVIAATQTINTPHRMPIKVLLFRDAYCELHQCSIIVIIAVEYP